MNKIICDICKKEITPADIHISFNIDVENKSERLDFHSICFAYFKDFTVRYYGKRFAVNE